MAGETTASTAKKKEEKKYRVIGKELGASVDGVITCYVNGIQYRIKENEPAVLSYLRDTRVTTHKETGMAEEDAVDIKEGFQINVKKKFEILEV